MIGEIVASLKGNISKFFAWIMVSIVIISLAGFGIQDVILGSTGRNIATVGKEKISINEFLRSVENEIVNLDSLVKKGLIFKPKFPLKILGNGKLSVKLKVQAHAFTKVAKQKIEDAGGSCELINNK